MGPARDKAPEGRLASSERRAARKHEPLIIIIIIVVVIILITRTTGPPSGARLGSAFAGRQMGLLVRAWCELGGGRPLGAGP